MPLLQHAHNGYTTRGNKCVSQILSHCTLPRNKNSQGKYQQYQYGQHGGGISIGRLMFSFILQCTRTISGVFIVQHHWYSKSQGKRERQTLHSYYQENLPLALLR